MKNVTYPLDVGTVKQEGYTKIGKLYDGRKWRIKKDKITLLSEDAVSSDANGWETVPSWATTLEVRATQKVAKTIYNCVFKGGGKREEIEKCYFGKRSKIKGR